MRILFLGLAVSVFWAAAGYACSTDTPCEVGDRAYFAALPDEADAPIPAVVFLHGWGSTGQGALRNSGMVNGFTERGYAVIAPDGRPRSNGGGRSWAFHPLNPEQAADIAFLEEVRDDAIERLRLDPNRIMLAGFSIGGSMVAYTACNAPRSFAAYAPIGGNFWRPHPTECDGPVQMLHTHGWTDGVVPLEGRVVNDLPANDPNAFTQGDIFHAMAIWRETNGCVHLKADRFVTEGLFWRRIWDRCDAGTALELAVFPGGHMMPTEWPGLVADWFEAK